MKLMPNAVLNAYKEKNGQLEKLNPNIFVWQQLKETRHLKLEFEKYQVKNGVFEKSQSAAQDVPAVVMRVLVK